MRRSRVVPVTLSLFLAACAATSPAPSAPRGPLATGGGSTISMSPPPSVTGGRVTVGTQVPCDRLNDSFEVVKAHLQLFVGAADDTAYSRLLDPSAGYSPVPDQYLEAVDALGTLPGQAETADELRNLGVLYKSALASRKPFSDGSGTGARLVAGARDANLRLPQQLDAALRRAGCEGV